MESHRRERELISSGLHRKRVGPNLCYFLSFLQWMAWLENTLMKNDVRGPPVLELADKVHLRRVAHPGSPSGQRCP